jgi:uncharacterized protein YjbI with pentapeptide repeats
LSGVTIASPINFESCDISYSVFNSLNLKELKLRNSKVHDVDFSESHLNGADFFKSDLKNSRFSSSKLENCNFQEAINYQIDPLENSIKGAKFSSPEALSLLKRFKIIID